MNRTIIIRKWPSTGNLVLISINRDNEEISVFDAKGRPIFRPNLRAIADNTILIETPTEESIALANLVLN